MILATAFVGLLIFIFIPISTIIYGVIVCILYSNAIVSFILYKPFEIIIKIGIVLVQYFWTSVLNYNIELGEINKSVFLFNIGIIYLSILPYFYNFSIMCLSRLLKKLNVASDSLIQLFISVLNKLSVRFWRYFTYYIAFIIYVSCYLGGIDGNSEFYIIKESLLAFIIIDVIIFDIYSMYKEKREMKQKEKNKQIAITLIKQYIETNMKCKIKCERIHTQLNICKNIIIVYNLIQRRDIKAQLKLSDNSFEEGEYTQDIEEPIKKINARLNEVTVEYDTYDNIMKKIIELDNQILLVINEIDKINIYSTFNI